MSNNARGVMAVRFKCPKCGSDRWGTRDGVVGVCRGPDCLWAEGGPFTWSRARDFRFFYREIDGTGFETAEQYEQTIGVTAGIAVATTRRTLPEMLHELLTEIMERPPTVAVVQLWQTDELRQALRWCSGELASRGPWGDGRRVERPAFIEEGAATA